jgi:hypothetical protein
MSLAVNEMTLDELAVNEMAVNDLTPPPVQLLKLSKEFLKAII